MSKSNLEKAAPDAFDTFCPEVGATIKTANTTVRFHEESQHLVGWCDDDPLGESVRGPDLESATVGEIIQFAKTTAATYELGFCNYGAILGDPSITPGDLAGSASGKGRNFEQALMDSVSRLEKRGRATMGRYPVASVMMKGSKFPMQVSSLPDFEGIAAGGKQFIWEAKVCSQPSFRIVKDKIKHKQVRHMLLRSQFGAVCYLVLHFNERLGKTFYDQAFTVAIPVMPVSMGGWDVWEAFAEASKKDKNKEFASITREMAREMGVELLWSTPPRCKNAYPDTEPIMPND